MFTCEMAIRIVCAFTCYIVVQHGLHTNYCSIIAHLSIMTDAL